VIVTVVALVAITWYASRSLQQFYLAIVRSDLEARARLVERSVADDLLAERYDNINQLCKEVGWETGTRVTVMLVDGRVVGDTREDPARMENHRTRPEVVAALSDGIGSSIRYSTTLRTRLMYVAIPLDEAGRPVGVIRAAIPVTAIDATLREMYARMALGGLIVALVAALVSFVISRRISQPLEALKVAAQKFARGELDTPLPVPDSEEIGALADAMNAMAAQLDDRIKLLEEQRKQEEAVLESMTESVVAVDSDDRLMIMNHAAAELFGVDAPRSIGRPIAEVVRNSDVLALVARAFRNQLPVEQEITLYDPEERWLQAHGTVLRGASGSSIGALLVLNDVTRLRRLERVRRDFVANVSHELKTPITAIKGFVETLLGGAIQDKEAAERFLNIIGNHTERLHAIIEDLLALSRLDQQSDEQIEVQPARLHELAVRAVEVCRAKARARRIEFVVDDQQAVEAAVNAPLIENALVNLIDNAVKYSDEGGVVRIELGRHEGETVIEVSDEGCGIEKEHLTRIFERFYRTDSARSRALGGTGLGLAIVKHIATAHGGRVTVKSIVGQGSTFTIHLPDRRG